jgi:hypothetical protein
MGGRRKQGLELKQGIYIVGEGITEQYYFLHLKQLKKYTCIVKPRFFGKTNIEEIQNQVERLLSGDINVICVFDADVSERNQAERTKLNHFIQKYGRNKNVIICDSLPSIEFWFLLHYINTNRPFQNSKEVERALIKRIPDYRKTGEYLENIKWVEKIIDRLEFACKNAKSLRKEDGSSYSNIYKAIETLENSKQFI